MAEKLRDQAEYATRLEGRLERSQIQQKTADELRREAARELKHERDRAAKLDAARNLMYSALVAAQAKLASQKRRYSKTIGRIEKLAHDYLVELS